MVGKPILPFVTPFAGVWIEIVLRASGTAHIVVTPFAGVWIEISQYTKADITFSVTPFAGVWIEIHYHPGQYKIHFTSLPSRECGLKSTYQAWHGDDTSHSLRGSVD